jgi:hypothetical protein
LNIRRKYTKKITLRIIFLNNFAIFEIIFLQAKIFAFVALAQNEITDIIGKRFVFLQHDFMSRKG